MPKRLIYFGISTSIPKYTLVKIYRNDERDRNCWITSQEFDARFFVEAAAWI